ncbi:hypothetical protein [Desulforhopalus singaporensis]|uniref:Uncharacterized protein n=1 Tax=Desulforhopalus singaporensis TaxID=91360 RepID=A0A1H0LGY0_9BACT|nr:hypothetical protein [Desulforhopalus singaporensis]SDO67488.1 hypothetical protein SAMN05660330_00800 [Desulforhopalus singaporensis]
MEKPDSTIADREYLAGDDLGKLGFLLDSSSFFYRRHPHQGLRSHIFEILSAKDVDTESVGQMDPDLGIRLYPRARPRYMLRILRKRFTALDDVLEEVRLYKLILHYLGPDFIALSTECIVECQGEEKAKIMLCGVQEYVSGVKISPWNLTGRHPLATCFETTCRTRGELADRVARATGSVAIFINRIRRMIAEVGYIPDIAGNGNLIVTPSGKIKIVDINNVVPVRFDESIFLDDRGYPACDKAIEALSLFERKIVGSTKFLPDGLYQHFLAPERVDKVNRVAEQFHQKFRDPGSWQSPA